MQPANSEAPGGAAGRRASTAARSRSRVARCLIAGAAALLVATQPISIGSTEATWQDSEEGVGSFSPVKLQPPTMAGCSAASVLVLGPTITATWRLPAGAAVGNIQGYLNGTAITMTTTGPVSGVYTSSVSGGLLTLGGTYRFTLRTLSASGTPAWVSDKAALATATFPVLGTPTCLHTNGVNP